MSNPATRDSLEFALLASKRLQYYQQQGLAVSSVSALKRRISADKNVEIAFLLLARADWTKPETLGITLARRTWAGHLALDYLASHPARIIKGPNRIDGIGKGLLYGVAQTAFEIGAKVLWGETTSASAPKYRHIFGLKKVDDLLYVPGADLRGFRRAMKEKMTQSNLRKY